MKRPTLRRLAGALPLLILLLAAPGAFAGGQEEAPPPPRLRLAAVLPENAGFQPYAAVLAGTRRAVEEAELVALEESLPAFPGEMNQRIRDVAEAGNADVLVAAGNRAATTVVQTPGDVQSILFDAVVLGDPRVSSLGVNHRELSYLAGYAIGQVLADEATGRASIVVGDTGEGVQEVVEPAFALGVQAVAPEVEIAILYLRPDFTGSDIRSILAGHETDALFVLGSAEAEVLAQAVRDRELPVAWQNRFGPAPEGGFLARAGVDLEEYAYRRVRSALDGELSYGEPEILAPGDELLHFSVNPERFPGDEGRDRAERVRRMRERLESGEIELLVPEGRVVRAP